MVVLSLETGGMDTAAPTGWDSLLAKEVVLMHY